MKKEVIIEEFYQRLIYGTIINKAEFDNIIDICIHNAYLSICRALKEVKKYKKSYDKILKKRLKTLLTNDNINFDEWHMEVCNEIVDSYKKANYKNFNYGIAQKIVNLSLKYFFCIMLTCSFKNKSDVKFTNFDKCHATLDKRVMTEIRKFSSEIKYSKITQIDTYQNYIECQEAIRKYLKLNEDTTSPFFWEFKIWNKNK